jgi:hypothetical protein
MSGNRVAAELQGLFGALLGGMMASFVGLALFIALQERTGAIATYSALISVLVGLACAIASMVAALRVMGRMPWLGSSLLFASGFTTMWSVALSFNTQQGWAVLAALGVAIATGAIAGWRHFEGSPRAIDPSSEEVAWTH